MIPELKDVLFPYPSIRKIQDEMILKVSETVKKKQHLVMHAPTGIGKTSILGPVLAHAVKEELSVFFLTSRHTQHKIAIDTIRKIKEKYGVKFTTVDIIGKRWMCPQVADTMYSLDFNEYCKLMVEEGKCNFYSNTRQEHKKPTVAAQKLLEEIQKNNPVHIEELMELCKRDSLCPYEISLLLASCAQVVVADYFYIFSPVIQENFFSRAKKKLGKSIIIVDEAHNLPGRMRELLTHKISTMTLQRAISEASKFHYKETLKFLDYIKSALLSLTTGLQNNEKLISRQEFVTAVNNFEDYDKLSTDFEFIGNEVREKQKQSYIGSIAAFLDAWNGDDEGYVRILSSAVYRNKEIITLAYRCLDPSIITKPIIEQVHSIICMSGTLTPTIMYKDLLGFPKEAQEVTFGSPFPKENRLHIIIPETTTKFTERNIRQYERIAQITAEITNLIPGNSAIFFPSYQLRDEIANFFSGLCKKTIFSEMPRMSKKEKYDFLERFKSYKNSGAVLLGVASGSYGEGIDLPGDFLKGVIVVGLPLQPPNLEQKELINYYEHKFNKGWEYGYILPAITKSVQNAGRCIRDETDRGVMIFLDERYAWNTYLKCFPLDWNVKITKLYKEKIIDFFNVKK